MTEQGAIITLARFIARKRIKERWLACGRRMAEISFKDVVERADELIAAQPEILDEAAEMIRQSPALQRLIKRPRQRAKLTSDAQR
jgi:hypothetical protein